MTNKLSKEEVIEGLKVYRNATSYGKLAEVIDSAIQYLKGEEETSLGFIFNEEIVIKTKNEDIVRLTKRNLRKLFPHAGFPPEDSEELKDIKTLPEIRVLEHGGDYTITGVKELADYLITKLLKK